MLTATDIRKSFGKAEVLKGISLSAGKGDVIAMIGSETAITPTKDAATILLTVFFIKTLLFLFILQP